MELKRYKIKDFFIGNNTNSVIFDNVDKLGIIYQSGIIYQHKHNLDITNSITPEYINQHRRKPVEINRFKIEEIISLPKLKSLCDQYSIKYNQIDYIQENVKKTFIFDYQQFYQYTLSNTKNVDLEKIYNFWLTETNSLLDSTDTFNITDYKFPKMVPVDLIIKKRQVVINKLDSTSPNYININTLLTKNLNINYINTNPFDSKELSFTIIYNIKKMWNTDTLDNIYIKLNTKTVYTINHSFLVQDIYWSFSKWLIDNFKLINIEDKQLLNLFNLCKEYILNCQSSINSVDINDSIKIDDGIYYNNMLHIRNKHNKSLSNTEKSPLLLSKIEPIGSNYTIDKNEPIIEKLTKFDYPTNLIKSNVSNIFDQYSFHIDNSLEETATSIHLIRPHYNTILEKIKDTEFNNNDENRIPVYDLNFTHINNVDIIDIDNFSKQLSSDFPLLVSNLIRNQLLKDIEFINNPYKNIKYNDLMMLFNDLFNDININLCRDQNGDTLYDSVNLVTLVNYYYYSICIDNSITKNRITELFKNRPQSLYTKCNNYLRHAVIGNDKDIKKVTDLIFQLVFISLIDKLSFGKYLNVVGFLSDNSTNDVVYTQNINTDVIEELDIDNNRYNYHYKFNYFKLKHYLDPYDVTQYKLITYPTSLDDNTITTGSIMDNNPIGLLGLQTEYTLNNKYDKNSRTYYNQLYNSSNFTLKNILLRKYQNFGIDYGTNKLWNTYTFNGIPCVDVINGVNKLTGANLSKSNYYSIDVVIPPEYNKDNIQEQISEYIFSMIEKYMPVHTKLLTVNFK